MALSRTSLSEQIREREDRLADPRLVFSSRNPTDVFQPIQSFSGSNPNFYPYVAKYVYPIGDPFIHEPSGAPVIKAKYEFADFDNPQQTGLVSINPVGTSEQIATRSADLSVLTQRAQIYDQLALLRKEYRFATRARSAEQFASRRGTLLGDEDEDRSLGRFLKSPVQRNTLLS